jgi:hypothetical protein
MSVWWKSADILEKYIVFIFRAEEKDNQAGSKQSSALCWFLAWLTLQYVPPKHRLTFT